MKIAGSCGVIALLPSLAFADLLISAYGHSGYVPHEYSWSISCELTEAGLFKFNHVKAGEVVADEEREIYEAELGKIKSLIANIDQSQQISGPYPCDVGSLVITALPESSEALDAMGFRDCQDYTLNKSKAAKELAKFFGEMCSLPVDQYEGYYNY